MDELIYISHPFVRTFANHAKHIISVLIGFIYPYLNALYNTNPTVASVILLLLTAYFVIKIVNWVTEMIWYITKNIFRFFLVAGLALVLWKYSMAKFAPRLTEDGQVLEGFDWDATWNDVQGVWGLVRNMGGVIMDLIESGSNLEDGNAANSGRRKTAGKKAAGMMADAWFN
ncbi:hypothetical protein AA313_de0210377 [Arthrobotrys entomopaga]|nr:hypothetical protein AA313_de0210377 [Arthrobotrys entomopaga]